MKTLDALSQVVAFFEERRGRLTAFAGATGSIIPPRRRARAVRRSTRRSAPATARTTTFPLLKTLWRAHAPYQRPIAKPVAGTVRVAVDGIEQTRGHRLHLDATTGVVTFLRRPIPAAGAAVTRGIPVRRAGALRHRLSRSGSLGLRGRQRSRKFRWWRSRPMRPCDSVACSDALHPERTCAHPSRSGKLDAASPRLPLLDHHAARRRREGFTDHDEDLTVAAHALPRRHRADRIGGDRAARPAVDGSEIAGALADDSLDRSRSRGRAATMPRASRCYLVDWSEPSLNVLLAQGRARRGAARGRGVHRRVALARASPQRGERAALHRDLLGRSRRRALHASISPIRPSTAAARWRRSPAPPRSARPGLDGFADGWFTAGKLTFTSGANAGFAVEVKTHRVALDGVQHRAVAGDAGADRARATRSPSPPAATSASRPAATVSPMPSISAAFRTSRATISSSAIRSREPGNDGRAS